MDTDRMALIGVSRDPKKFANVVFRELQKTGYEVVPVNPHADHVEGVPAFRSVADLPDIDRAIIMLPPAESARLVAECADRGIEQVWLHKGAGTGSVTEEAVAIGRERGLEVIDGACPLMFLAGTGFIHRLHRRLVSHRFATT
ncbi:MAG: CoA-binding protein [Acidimicrobiales bacterium]